jgi:hypothetical protein
MFHISDSFPLDEGRKDFVIESSLKVRILSDKLFWPGGWIVSGLVSLCVAWVVARRMTEWERWEEDEIIW